MTPELPADLAPSPARFDEHAPRPVPSREAQAGTTLPRLVGVMRRLLDPGGCPWDREQTFESLRRYVLEEACEVIDAIDAKDRDGLREELGDLLLQVVFQAELARTEGSFAIDDVIASIVEKLVRRHPHVFAGPETRSTDGREDGRVDGGSLVNAETSEDVLRNWELLKAEEKRGRPILGGVPRSLPALTRAQRVGEKVSRVGFDWEDRSGSRAKVAEELGELDAAIARGDRAGVEEELGDLLFALVNLARHLGVDAEAALRGTTDKFTRRFAHVEVRVNAEHGGFGGRRASADGAGTVERGLIPLAVLDAYWDEAKAAERTAARDGGK